MPEPPPNEEHFSFEVDNFDQTFYVTRFQGCEALSRLFHFTIECLVEDRDIDFVGVVGQPACLTLHSVEGERHIHGLVSRFEQGADIGRFTRCSVELVPHLWLLQHRQACRIFTETSVPAIIIAVLEEAGMDRSQYRLALNGTYEDREYCVQYRESDFHFISRLMEDEGIFYFFEHSKENHLLVLGDSLAAHMPIAEPHTIRYMEPRGLVPEADAIAVFRYAQAIRSNAVSLQDYNFQKPSLHMQVDAEAEAKHGLELYDYPGKYTQPEAGERLARIRLEELQATKMLAHGDGDCHRFIPGYQFTMEQHGRADFNRDYLLTHVEAEGVQPRHYIPLDLGEKPTYTNTFTCIPADVPFRPSRVTRKPVVKGIQTAVVVGPEGEEINTDRYGRVKVRFHWDRELRDSCWVRVSQSWAGASWGAMQLPRIGQEVVVDFLEGDPDRPLVTGGVYNGEQQPPYILPDNKTKSTIKSRSTPDGNGFNEVRFDDAKGEDQLFIHAEKNMDVRVKHDQRQSIGNDYHRLIKRDRREQVGRDRHLLIKRDDIQQITRDRNLTVKGKETIKVVGSRSLSVQGNVSEEFKGNHSEQVSMHYYLKGMDIVIEAMTGLTLKVGGSFITINAAGVQISGPMIMINSGGAALPGQPGRIVPPLAPMAAETQDAPWHQEPEDEDDEKSWIEIQLVDEADQPIAGERYRITLPDGQTVAEGTTNAEGMARVSGIDPGTCQITFPDLDKDAWEKIG